MRSTGRKNTGDRSLNRSRTGSIAGRVIPLALNYYLLVEGEDGVPRFEISGKKELGSKAVKCVRASVLSQKESPIFNQINELRVLLTIDKNIVELDFEKLGDEQLYAIFQGVFFETGSDQERKICSRLFKNGLMPATEDKTEFAAYLKYIYKTVSGLAVDAAKLDTESFEDILNKITENMRAENFAYPLNSKPLDITSRRTALCRLILLAKLFLKETYSRSWQDSELKAIQVFSEKSKNLLLLFKDSKRKNTWQKVFGLLRKKNDQAVSCGNDPCDCVDNSIDEETSPKNRGLNQSSSGEDIDAILIKLEEAMQDIKTRQGSAYKGEIERAKKARDEWIAELINLAKNMDETKRDALFVKLKELGFEEALTASAAPSYIP